MSYTFHVPTKVLFGPGALKRLHEEQLPGKKALLVISNGKSVRANGYLAALEAELDAAGVAHVLFDKIQANPLEPTVQEGVEAEIFFQCTVQLIFHIGRFAGKLSSS